jgi:hypothetical protein
MFWRTMPPHFIGCVFLMRISIGKALLKMAELTAGGTFQQS